jgi:Glucodextranase, domain B/Bacterial Ig domain
VAWVDFDQDPDRVLVEDPVVAFRVTLAPGQSRVLEYRVAWPAAPVDVGETTLAAWASAWRVVSRPYRTAPPLRLLAPADGSTTQNRVVEVRGISTPGTTATVAGRRVTVPGSGRFTVRVRLDRGKNVLRVEVANLAGYSDRKSVTVAYRPPTSGGGGGVQPSRSPTATPSAKPTASNDLPPVWVNQSLSWTLTGDYKSWTISIPTAARDPEGKLWVYSRGYADNGSVSVGCSSAPLCLVYTPSSRTVVKDTITYWVKDPAGNESTSAGTIRITINRYA